MELNTAERLVLDTFGQIEDGEVIVSLRVPGRPVSQKNSKKISRNRRTGQPFVVSNQKVQEWFGEGRTLGAVGMLAMQWAGRPPIPRSTRVRAVVVARIAPRQHPDVDNLAAAPLDAMAKAGILVNDSCVDRLLVSRERVANEAQAEVVISLVVDGGVL